MSVNVVDTASQKHRIVAVRLLHVPIVHGALEDLDGQVDEDAHSNEPPLYPPQRVNQAEPAGYRQHSHQINGEPTGCMPDQSPDIAEQLVLKHEGSPLCEGGYGREEHDGGERQVGSTDEHKEEVNSGAVFPEKVGEADEVEAGADEELSCCEDPVCCVVRSPSSDVKHGA